MPNVLKYVKARSFTLQSQCAGIHSHNPGLCCVCVWGGGRFDNSISQRLAVPKCANKVLICKSSRKPLKVTR